MKNNSIEQDTVWYNCGIFMNRILQTVKSIQAFTDKKNFLTSQNSTRSKIKGQNSDKGERCARDFQVSQHIGFQSSVALVIDAPHLINFAN